MRVLHDNVLIQPELPPEKTEGGILLMTKNIRELPPYGRVIAIGPDITDVSIGDRVVFSAYGGVELDDDVICVPYTAILGVDDES